MSHSSPFRSLSSYLRIRLQRFQFQATEVRKLPSHHDERWLCCSDLHQRLLEVSWLRPCSIDWIWTWDNSWTFLANFHLKIASRCSQFIFKKLRLCRCFVSRFRSTAQNTLGRKQNSRVPVPIPKILGHFLNSVSKVIFPRVLRFQEGWSVGCLSHGPRYHVSIKYHMPEFSPE